MNSQSKASAKWAEKNGLMIKSFKIKKDLAERFAKACETREISQAEAISKLMEQFIAEK